LFGLHRETVSKMLRFSVPPGYRRSEPVRRPKLDAFTGVIDRILEEDRSAPRKQRHTAKRIFERLRDEHGFEGGYTIVKDYVRERRLRSREVFVPLAHDPGHAQVDFGEAKVVVAGVERKAHFFAMDLPHSDACFLKAYPAEISEAFCDGHVASFAFFGGVPRSILYDNTTLAVARILGDGTRQRTRIFSELQSHYLFADRFGRPGKGNDKGKVEGLIGYARRNFLVPIPRFESFEALNTHLEARCRERQGARLRGHEETIATRMARDRAAFLPLSPKPYHLGSASLRWIRRNPDHQLTEVVALQEPLEGLGRVLQPVDEVLPILDPALADPAAHPVDELRFLFGEVPDDETVVGARRRRDAVGADRRAVPQHRVFVQAGMLRIGRDSADQRYQQTGSGSQAPHICPHSRDGTTTTRSRL
jgi:transposase